MQTPDSVRVSRFWLGDDPEAISAFRDRGAGIGGPEISDEVYIPSWAIIALEGAYLLYKLLKWIKKRSQKI